MTLSSSVLLAGCRSRKPSARSGPRRAPANVPFRLRDGRVRVVYRHGNILLPVPGLSEILFLLLFLAFLLPPLQRGVLNRRRYRAIRQLERDRGSRVVTLIHRQESVS